MRWYVEGETELGALNYVFDQYSPVQIINVKGRFVEKGELSFRESLRLDLDARFFSFILLDSDREDYVRVVKKAAKDDEICGMFVISVPDIEFANFDLPELEEIIWKVATDNGAEEKARKTLHAAIGSAETGNQLVELASKSLPELHRFSKGEEWGKRLMEYALENPNRKSSGDIRPMIDQVHIARRSTSIGYNVSRMEYRVDPETGRLIKRNTNE